MLYFITAIQPEAFPLITHYGLRSTNARYGRLYISEETVSDEEKVLLTISGVGAVSAAMSLSEVFTLYPPKKNDILINIGICGATNATIGDVFRINKITDISDNRDFYPDILQPTVFREAPLLTVPTISNNPHGLTDMEASGIYQAGVPFFSPDRMFFYKLVSDFGSAFPKPDEVSRLVENALPEILSEVSSYQVLLESSLSFTESDITAIKRFATYIDASVTMEHEIRRLCEYILYRSESPRATHAASETSLRDTDENCEVSIQNHGSVASVINEFLSTVPEPVHKKEGKLLLERFKKQILS